MSIRNLKAVFRPRAVALIGASKRAHSVGAVVARNLLQSGFEGPVMPVNPKHDSIEGVLAYPDIKSLPVVPDLAVICTPPDTVPGLVAELGARGTRGVIVITAGFGELGAEGKALEQRMLQAAQPHLLRIVGPNCVGIMVPAAGLNASFAHLSPRRGDLAFVTQSGAMVTSVLDWAQARGIGFSHVVSLGGMSDVDFGDMLDYLANDPDTRAILLYIEAVTQARKFMSAARAAARLKPVVVIKAGRHAESAKAAASHTGAMAGSDAVYDAAFRRAGMLRVYDLDELFDAVETLAAPPPFSGERLAILTNGGGVGVLATDALLDLGGKLADLSAGTLAKLDAVLPKTWSHGNPVDIIGDATGERYAAALKVLLEAPETQAVLVLNCPTAIASSLDAAEAVMATLGEKRRAVWTCWLGEGAAHDARQLFASRRIPTYETPDKAVRGFMHLVRYRRNQDALMETPPSVPREFRPDVAAARRFIGEALAQRRDWLSEPEAKGVLAAYGIPVSRTLIAATPEEAAARAKAIGGPVAIKILSPDITHKSDVGGVMLDLETPEEVRAAAMAMQARVARAAPNAKLTGFTVQEMIRRPGAYELILGIADDRQFGPVILFGHGGTATEVIADTATALPPLNMNLARELIGRTRIVRLLQGYRDRKPADLDAVALTLIQLAQLAADLDEVAELDINPLLADAQGVMALDARIKVREPGPARGTGRLAIRPYPQELEDWVEIGKLGRVRLRPIRPEDEPYLVAAFAKLDPEDIRMRFFAPMKALPHDMAARLTQIDYDREMALILERPETKGDIIGVVRLAADPDGTRAEFAIIVRSDVKGNGIGAMMMKRIIDYARTRRIGAIFGDVLHENTRMLALCRELGFTIEEIHADAGIVRATLAL